MINQEETVLAVETATHAGSVALVRGGRLLGESTIVRGAFYAETLLKTIDALLKECGVSLSGVDRFAVSTGPGAFTGLRIGMATVRGLALGAGRPVTGVPTLEAFALRLPFGPDPVRPAVNARRNEVYTALYRCEGPGLTVCLEPPRMVSIDGLLSEQREPVRLLGDFPFVHPAFRYPSALSVALAALDRRDENEENLDLIWPPFPAHKAEAHGRYL